MTAKPIAALDAQLSLIRFFSTSLGTSALDGFIKSTRRVTARQAEMFKPSDTGEMMAMLQRNRLNRATTFYVENDMIALAQHATYSMPRQPFLYTDLPCDHGFVFFETPILTRDSRGRDVAVSCVSWGPGIAVSDDGEQSHGVNIWHFSDVEDPRDTQHEELSFLRKTMQIEYKSVIPRHTLFHCNNFVFGEHVSELTEHTLATVRTTQNHGIDKLVAAVTGEEQPDDEWAEVPQSALNNAETGTVEVNRFFYAFLILSQQRIASTRSHRLDRHAARRMKREMSDPPADGTVQVVSLRRYSPPRDKDDDEGLPINWTHRWIVHGFWRNQWYPSVNAHRLIWINDYVKGPDDLPLVVKDTVYDLRR